MTHQPPFAPPPGWESQSPAPARFTIHYGFALLAFFSLLGTIIPSVIMFVGSGNAANSTDRGAADAAGVLGTFGVLWLLWGGMWTLVYVAFAINHTLKERRRA